MEDGLDEVEPIRRLGYRAHIERQGDEDRSRTNRPPFALPKKRDHPVRQEPGRPNCSGTRLFWRTGARSGRSRTSLGTARKHYRQGLRASRPRLPGDRSQSPAHRQAADAEACSYPALRLSGHEGEFTQTADGRRNSCFQSSREVRRSTKSTKVHRRIQGSPRVWTRSSFEQRPSG